MAWTVRLSWREQVLLVTLSLSVVTMSLLSDTFLTAANLLRTTQYAAEVGLLALPMTMIIISRGIDLSVASNMALSAMLMGLAWQHGLSIWVALTLGILTGTAAGWLNGWVIARLRVPAIVVTLATLAVYRGVATGLSGGRGIVGFPEAFLWLGSGRLVGIPFQTLIWVGLVGLSGVVLSRTALGRYIYGIGHNEVALRFSGIPVDRVTLGLYVASGAVAGLTGVLYAARVATAKSNAAMGYELAAITAVVLGGTSLAGGEGTILGTVLGVLVISILQNGLTLARVPAAVQDVLIGTILLLAVLGDRIRPERRGVKVEIPSPISEPSPVTGGEAMQRPGQELAAGEGGKSP
jgi:ribose/xylose/arabinose/galactoside ABC-type transport system permease subunit